MTKFIDVIHIIIFAINVRAFALTEPPAILFTPIHILIDSRPLNVNVIWECVLLWSFFSNWQYLSCFIKVIPSFSYSEIEAIKALRIKFRKNYSATWSETAFGNFMDNAKSKVVGGFRGIFGIHPIKAFSGD